MVDADAIVIGAGAVGLACGAALARRGRIVYVLERERSFGAGISSRNSEVIHAGLYYPTGSWKHRLCVAGRRRLYQYLQDRAVPHARCGKLLVATDEAERRELEAIYDRGLANAVEGLALLEGAQARRLEPALRCVAAIESRETGVFDSRQFMLALTGEIADAGGVLAYCAPVERIEPQAAGGFDVFVGGPAPTALATRELVNAAGLFAPAVARRIQGLAAERTPRQWLAKGAYFSCAAKPVFSRLVYPIPADGGLGVHVTLDLGGRMRFGPNIEWLDQDDPDAVDYAVEPSGADGFYAAVRRYWPDLPDGAIRPDYAGCRPKLSGPGAPAADFRIDGPERHGLDGLVNLFGIESPGLTSALAIAELVAARLENAPDPF